MTAGHAALETIAQTLNDLPEVRWERFVSRDEELEVYGWLEVDTFLLLRFTGLDDATLVSWVCSDPALADREGIADRLGIEQGLVQSVSDVFGPAVPSAVRR